MNSNFLSLNWHDVLKAAIAAAISSGVTALLAALDTGKIPQVSELKAILLVATMAFVGSLGRSFITNCNGQVATTDKKSA